MKKSVLFLCALTMFCGAYAQSQKEELSMKGILEAASPYVNLIEREMGQEIVRMEFDIIQETKSTFRTLTSEYTYGICAFGDYRIEDIDIKVYKWTNEKWVLVEKDEDAENLACVNISPYSTSDYRIDISVYKFASGYSGGHYGLIIYHE